jgi:hypothetical protein
LPVPGEKLNIALMCVVTLMGRILRSAKRVRNFVRPSVLNVLISPIHLFFTEDIECFSSIAI